MTLSPNPELLQTEKQGSEPLLPLIAPSALFSIVFLSLHFSFIFSPFFSFSPFFFFSFPLSFPSFHISSLFFFHFFFLFSFYHCFRPDVKSSDLSQEKKFLFGVEYTTYAVIFDIWDQYQKSAGQAGHFH